MRKSVILIILLALSNLGITQIKNGVHTKLAELYENEEWEDCCFKAERMSFQGKYEKDAEVFLYMASTYNKIFLMCLEDSLLLYSDPEYINSYDNALKYSVTAKRNDKKAKVFFPANNDILEGIAISGIYYIDDFVNVKKKYPKANSFVRKIMKTYTDNNIYFMHGVLSAMSNDTINSKKVFNEVFAHMDTTPLKDSNTDFIMIEAYDYYFNHLMNREVPLRDSVRNFAEKGLSYFPDNEILLYWKTVAENPEVEIIKPENSKKVIALKKASSFISRDEDIEMENEDIDID